MNEDPFNGIVIRHNNVKNIIFKHVEREYDQNSVEIEPYLGELNDDERELVNGNLNDDANADILMKDFKEL